MQDVYKNIKEYNPHRKREVLIAFNDMIADMISNKKFNQIFNYYYLIEEEHQRFLLYISGILNSQYQKMLG